MPFLNNSIRDSGLATLTGSRTLHICTSEPTTYSEATSTLTVGNAAITLPSASDATPTGRRIVVPAVTDGSATATGTATHYAIVDGSTLLAANALSNSLAVASGNTFTTTTFDITLP
jgi:hypothetical protein